MAHNSGPHRALRLTFNAAAATNEPDIKPEATDDAEPPYVHAVITITVKVDPNRTGSASRDDEIEAAMHAAYQEARSTASTMAVRTGTTASCCVKANVT